MTAPGSSPAAHDISPDGAPEVEPEHYTGRHLHTGPEDGEAPGRWDDVSGRREDWGP
jgi:hypothetical protein